LSTVRAGDTHLIAAQNTDFILAARRAFEDNTSGDERKKWLALPYCGVAVPSQVKQLVDSGTLTAAIVTPVTLDKALEILVRHVQTRSQPQQQTFVKASSEPSLDELIKKYG
jgi:hypothetical protein